MIPAGRDIRGDDQPCFVEVFENGYRTTCEVASRKPQFSFHPHILSNGYGQMRRTAGLSITSRT
jgi:hypothetical protein